MAGPMARARLTPTLESATAAGRSALSTNSGVVALQAGIISAVPMPMHRVSVNSSQTPINPDRLNPASSTAMVAIHSCTPNRYLRLSTMSANAPAGNARKNIGKAPATWTRATCSGLADRDVISQPAPTSCIQVPMFEAMLASHSQRKVVWRKGLQALGTGAFMGQNQPLSGYSTTRYKRSMSSPPCARLPRWLTCDTDRDRSFATPALKV